MSERVKQYLEDVLADIKEQEQLIDLKNELAANMAQRIDDLRENGLSEEEAFHKTIVEMGDIREAALGILAIESEPHTQLGKQHKTMMDKMIAVGGSAAIMLIMFGVVIGAMLSLEAHDGLMFWTSSLPFVVAGVFLGVLSWQFRAKLCERMQWWLAFVNAVAGSVMIFGMWVMGIIYCTEGYLYAALPVAIPFIIPSSGVVIFIWLWKKTREDGQV